jgi:hypothetical protein
MTLVPLVIAAAMLAEDHPTGPRLTPPTIRQVAPLGVSRGASVEMTVEGFNLAGASRVYFSEPGVEARILRVKELPDLPDVRLGSNGTPSTIDVGPLPPRNQVTLEVEVDPKAPIGPVSFRVQTPYGLTPAASFLIEPYYGESPDNEPNDTLETAFDTYLPSILAGTISRPGDVDLFKIRVRAGEALTFESTGRQAGSALMPVIEIIDSGMNVVAKYTDAAFQHRFESAGSLYIRISDYQRRGSANHFYRVRVGDFPFVPMSDASRVRPDLAMEVAPRRAPKVIPADGAAELTASTTVTGLLDKGPREFRFRARAKEELVFEVKAQRLGSRLDSFIEILDAKRQPVEMAVARPVWETNVTLRDHDSQSRGIRIQGWNAMKAGDYVMIGGSILRIEALPKTPDDDMIFESFNGQRIAYFGTSPEAHAIDSPVYKVLLFPPGKTFSPNGLPLARLTYRNDDGGPGFGKDSYLRFQAPADGQYIVRVGDVRQQAGPEHRFELTMRAPEPDFQLSVAPRNPNVPAGGTIPLTVTAMRLDGLTEAIEVELKNLPPGFTATKALIARGQNFGTILLSAEPGAKLDEAAPLEAVGRAGKLERAANPDDKLKYIALAPKPDVVMTAETRELLVEAGSTGEVTVSIQRQNGFGGRVPIEVRNLPPYVRVMDVGLNGVLLNEDETRRTFTIEALPMAEELDQTIYVSGAVETRANGQQNSYAAPQTIQLRVRKPVTSGGGQ